MRKTAIPLGLALALTAASGRTDQTHVPARFVCKDGRVVGMEVLVPVAGRLVFTIPADACVPPRRQPSASSRLST